MSGGPSPAPDRCCERHHYTCCASFDEYPPTPCCAGCPCQRTDGPLAYPLTGEPMTLEPGKTYVLRSLRTLSFADTQRIKEHGDHLGVTFVVLDPSLEITEADR